MESIITNKFNSLPQQVWENKNNIEILNRNLQKYILNYRGTYSNNAVYKENDVVVFGSETYVHVYEAETSGQNPIEYPNIWKLYIAGASLLARVGETTTLPSGSEATVSIKKVVENNLDIFEFSFGIPQGIKGADGTNGTDGTNGIDGTNGKDGQSAEITNVTATATSGNQTFANVIMSGTPLERSFDFYFTLEKGEKGNDGATPTFTGVNINVVELEPSQTAYGNAFINQTSPNVYELLLTFGIPKGNAGINSGEIVNVGSVDSAEKTYSVTFLNAFANQVQTALQGLSEFKTTVENNALWANNSVKVYTTTEEQKTLRIDNVENGIYALDIEYTPYNAVSSQRVQHIFATNIGDSPSTLFPVVKSFDFSVTGMEIPFTQIKVNYSTSAKTLLIQCNTTLISGTANETTREILFTSTINTGKINQVRLKRLDGKHV